MKFNFYMMLLLIALCLAVNNSLWAGVDLPVPYLKQPDNQTCLPTCLAMTLHFMGKCDLTTDTVQMFQKQTRYDRYNVPRIVKNYDLYALPCWYELGWNAETLKKELDAGHPVITGCDLGRYGHFVLITGYTDDGKWIVNDPSSKFQGYQLGGEHLITNWEALNWRGGIFIHSEPFPEPEVSGKVMDVIAPKRMSPGEIAEVEVNIKNNGKKLWSEPIYLESVEPSFTSIIKRKSPFYIKRRWISQSRVAVVKTVERGDIASPTFKIKAPKVKKTTTFREYFNLLTADGLSLSIEPVSGPGILEISPKILVEPKFSKHPPLIEKARRGKPSKWWSVKFGTLEPDNSTTRPQTLCLLTLDKVYDVAWVGDSSWSDYKVEAMIYCDYRPDEKPEGWDRFGIFARDNGDYAGLTKNLKESGEFYCMTYDSDDGRLRAGNVLNGSIDDFHPKPEVYIKESGWHKFAIRCSGKTITYEIDDKLFHSEKDNKRKSGSCGVFYTTTFRNRSLSHGIRFGDFRVVK